MRIVGPKVVLIHGRRDTITTIAAMQQLATETGASLKVVDADHQQYLQRAGDEIRKAILDK